MIKVYTIKQKHIYPIFKNGNSSVVAYARDNQVKPLLGQQTRKVDCITVYLREPEQRFISGVHSFIEFERRKTHIDYGTVLHLIDGHGLSNEHFEPQYFWIKRLAAVFQGELQILPVSELLDLIDYRERPAVPAITAEQRRMIDQIQPDHKADRELLQWSGHKTPIHTITERIDDVLSKA